MLFFLAKQEGLNVERQREELSKVGGLNCHRRPGFPLSGNREPKSRWNMPPSWSLAVWSPVSVSDWLPSIPWWARAYLVVDNIDLIWRHTNSSPFFFFESRPLGWPWTCSVDRKLPWTRSLRLLSEDYRCLLLYTAYTVLVLNPGPLCMLDKHLIVSSV